MLSLSSEAPTVIAVFAHPGAAIVLSPLVGHDELPPGPQFPAATITIAPCLVALSTASDEATS
jgi:hypothetical protein